MVFQKLFSENLIEKPGPVNAFALDDRSCLGRVGGFTVLVGGGWVYRPLEVNCTLLCTREYEVLPQKYKCCNLREICIILLFL